MPHIDFKKIKVCVYLRFLLERLSYIDPGLSEVFNLLERQKKHSIEPQWTIVLACLFIAASVLRRSSDYLCFAKEHETIVDGMIKFFSEHRGNFSAVQLDIWDYMQMTFSFLCPWAHNILHPKQDCVASQLQVQHRNPREKKRC